MNVIPHALIGLACAAAIGWSARSTLTTRALADAQRHEYQLAAAQLAELGSLRHKAPTFVTADMPSEDLTRRITRSLTMAGLSPSAMTSLTPESDQAASAARTSENKPLYIRRSARLTLDGITLPQLGKFLEAWRSSEPGWLASSIDLSPFTSSESASRIKPANGERPASPRELPLRVLLTIEATIAADPASSTASPPSPPSSQGSTP